jgi:hypothetical protein
MSRQHPSQQGHEPSHVYDADPTITTNLEEPRCGRGQPHGADRLREHDCANGPVAGQRGTALVIALPATGSATAVATKTLAISLTTGTNVVRLSGASAAAVGIDRVTVVR